MTDKKTGVSAAADSRTADPELRNELAIWQHAAVEALAKTEAAADAPAEDRTPLMQSLAESDKRAKELPQWAVAIERAHARQYGGHVSAPTEVRCDGCDVLADPAIGLTLIGYKHYCGGTWRHSSAPAEDRPFNNVDAIRQWASGLSPSNSERIRLECVLAEVSRLTAALDAARDKAERYDRINTPELYEFVAAVENEALHQRERWPSDHDAGKADADWFWLIGYLAGKALHNPPKPDMGEIDAKLHRIITVAAAAANWHAAVLGTHTAMRPGIDLKAAARTQPEGSNG